MKLHNYTVLYLSGSLFVVLSIWAAIFYVNMLDEIHDSIDDGLENSKMLIIGKTLQDSSLLYKDNFFESNYRIREVRPEETVNYKDTYSDTTFFTENEKDFEPFRMLTTIFKSKNGKYYKLRVISSTVEEDDLVEDLLYALLSLYVILMLSVILINNFILKRVWKSFYNTLEKLKGYKISAHQEIDFGDTKVEEFMRLNHTLQELISSNKKTFEAQKQFIENAAHELQTPLAISINKLEWMAEKEKLSENQYHELGEIVNSLERLTRLNKTLLLLSKIENKQFAETENININSIIKKIAREFSELLEFKNLQINITENAVFNLQINKALAEILVSNLLKNAIVHNIENGRIAIIINDHSFSIKNLGIKELLPQKIFDRFYKDSTQKPSTGLGLAIVKSIAELYGLKIGYAFDGMHVFTITQAKL